MSQTITTFDATPLYNILVQIEGHEQIHSSVKAAMELLKEKIILTTPNLSVELLSKLSKSQLISNLNQFVTDLKFDQVQMILGTGIIQTDDSELGDVLYKLPCVSDPYNDEQIAKMLKILIDYGFDVKAGNYAEFRQNLDSRRLKSLAVFLDSGIDIIDVVLPDGGTALTRCLNSEHYLAAELLINKGAKINLEKINMSSLPESVRRLINEKTKLPVVPVQELAEVSEADQITKLDSIRKAIKVATGDMKFSEYVVVVTNIYEHLIKIFCDEFNAASKLFVAKFVTETSTLTVTFASVAMSATA